MCIERESSALENHREQWILCFLRPVARSSCYTMCNWTRAHAFKLLKQCNCCGLLTHQRHQVFYRIAHRLLRVRVYVSECRVLVNVCLSRLLLAGSTFLLFCLRGFLAVVLFSARQLTYVYFVLINWYYHSRLQAAAHRPSNTFCLLTHISPINLQFNAITLCVSPLLLLVSENGLLLQYMQRLDWYDYVADNEWEPHRIRATAKSAWICVCLWVSLVGSPLSVFIVQNESRIIYKLN